MLQAKKALTTTGVLCLFCPRSAHNYLKSPLQGKPGPVCHVGHALPRFYHASSTGDLLCFGQDWPPRAAESTKTPLTCLQYTRHMLLHNTPMLAILSAINAHSSIERPPAPSPRLSAVNGPLKGSIYCFLRHILRGKILFFHFASPVVFPSSLLSLSRSFYSLYSVACIALHHHTLDVHHPWSDLLL